MLEGAYYLALSHDVAGGLVKEHRGGEASAVDEEAVQVEAQQQVQREQIPHQPHRDEIHTYRAAAQRYIQLFNSTRIQHPRTPQSQNPTQP